MLGAQVLRAQSPADLGVSGRGPRLHVHLWAWCLSTVLLACGIPARLIGRRSLGLGPFRAGAISRPQASSVDLGRLPSGGQRPLGRALLPSPDRVCSMGGRWAPPPAACLPSPGPQRPPWGPLSWAHRRRQLAPSVTEEAAGASRILFPEALGRPLVTMPVEAGLVAWGPPLHGPPACHAQLRLQDRPEGSEWCWVDGLVRGGILLLSGRVTLCPFPSEPPPGKWSSCDPTTPCQERGWSETVGTPTGPGALLLRYQRVSPPHPLRRPHSCSWWARCI